jgi:2-hydroxychromene-2-carboxylate isomerase
MHDTLFENFNRLDGEHLFGYAQMLGLDMVRFERAINGRHFAGKVRADLISGLESGVKGTPTYFVNGEKHSGSGQFETLVAAVGNRMAVDEC